MKTAVVTGSTKGIGKAIALALLGGGNHYVILNYSNDDRKAEEVDWEIHKLGFQSFSILKSNLSTKEGVESFVNKVLEIRDSVDVLVLNASKTNRKNFHEMSFDEYMDIMNTNLNYPYYMLKLLDDSLNQKGSIIFTGSIMGQYPHATCLPYSVSKAAVHFMVKSLTKEFYEREITVNAVCPGFTNTPWQEGKPQAQRERIENKIAVHRFGEPEEIASTVMHIIGNRYINGAVINVDGGYNYY